jgi:hypothetical protein
MATRRVFFEAGVILRAVFIVAGSLLAAAPARGQSATLEDVLRRMRGAVVEYEHDLAGLVLQEDYEQRVLSEEGSVLQQQVLRSHYLVFQLPPEESWFACREVFEVNGEPVIGYSERLQGILTLDASAVDLAYKIYEESARYNLGDVRRTFNLPTFALAIFRPSYREHLRFTKLGEEPMHGAPAWVIGFDEAGPPMFIATPAGKGLRVRGRVWVAPADGRILRTELVVGGERRMRDRASVKVTFRFAPSVQLWVPDVMVEEYVQRRRGRSNTISGRAVYSQPRRLETPGRLRPAHVTPNVP